MANNGTVKTVLALSLVLLPLMLSPAAAQEMHTFDVHVTFVGEAENDDDAIDTKVDRSQIGASVAFPYPLGKGNSLILGAHYLGQFVEYQDVTAFQHPGNNLPITEDDLPEELQAVDVSIGYLRSWSERWSTLFQFKPGLHTDFDDISGNDVMYTALVLVERNMGGKNRLGVGVSYSDAFGEPEVFPLLLLDWYFEDEWFIESLLPLRLDAGVNLTPNFSAGVEGRLRGYQYRLTENAPWEDSVLNFREVRLGPYADYAFSEKAHVRLSGGAVVAQKFEFKDDDNDKVLLDGDLQNTGYLTLFFYIPF
jgi:hypothetical protein